MADSINEGGLRQIQDVAKEIGLNEKDIIPWGRYKCKINLNVINKLKNEKRGKIVLVTTMNPTPSGEGKTTVTIGLAQALRKLGKKVVVSIREPSIGPCMGIKGGATGGGKSCIHPINDINFHFTGDLYAVSSAHNLLSALIDNHLYRGNPLGIDPTKIIWPRVLDMDDRSLRHVVVGLGGKDGSVPREERFYITAASEIMAILCLASGLKDLKSRLSRIVLGYNYNGKMLRTKDVGGVGAMAALLKDALMPNLVQTTEGCPAIVHGGPFANIAHGTSSYIGAHIGMKCADYLITEAGFGSDLGAEKFFNILCRKKEMIPDVVVMVVTTKALKFHGGVHKKKLHLKNLSALRKGYENLDKHLSNISAFGLPVVAAINKFKYDKDDEIKDIVKHCDDLGVRCGIVDVYDMGGEGGLEVAKMLMSACNDPSRFQYTYELDASVKEKIESVALKIYGAERVVYTVDAERDIKKIDENNFSRLPVCIAKTQYSLSDDPKVLGRPRKFKITVREVGISAGAGFLVPVTGKINLMPGLPKNPIAFSMDVDENGNIIY